MSRVRTDFSAGRRFAKVAAQALSDGVTAATAAAQVASTRGMFRAPNQVRRRVSDSGIEYYTGKGAPVGGYPGVRTGRLERSLGFERAKVRQGGRVVGYLTNSARYAVYVHGTATRPLRPFLTLPFQRDRESIMRAFAKATRRRLG